jgi:hypothetical protein
MANPKNEFNGFFAASNMDSAMRSYRPPVKDVIKAMLKLVAEGPEFWKDERKRLDICCGLAYAIQEVEEAIGKGNMDIIDLYQSGCCMLMSTILSNTFDEFAGEEERKRFPNPNSYEEDED